MSMPMRRVWSVLLLVYASAVLSACIEIEANTCFALTCPSGWTCNETFEECFSPEQTRPCIDKAEGASCDFSGVPEARCESGVCLGNVCGNDRIDPGEVCDDGNTASGDGCNASCLSQEVCGNSVVDPASGEQCDDGNALSHDGCSSGCTAEQAAWTIVNPVNISPRSSVALAYDVARKRVVLFGGIVESGSSASTWEYDGQTWTEISTPSSPSARSSAAMTYDVQSKRIVLFGGRAAGGSALLDDTWVYDGSTWTELSPGTPPSARQDHAMVYNAASNQIMLFGGFGSGYLSDTWIFEDGDWSQALTIGPSGRQGRTLAYHTRLDTVFLHGGRGPTAGGVNFLTDTWQWTGSAWTPVAGSPPTGVGELIYDSSRDRLVVAGGTTNPIMSVWDGAWSDVSISESLPGLAGTVYDVSRRVAVRVGGFTSGFGRVSDVWELDGTAWALRDDIGAPSARAQANMSYDTRRHRAVFFGGQDIDTSVLRDTWEIEGGVWRTIDVRREPGIALPFSDLVYDELRQMTVLASPGLGGKMILWEFAGDLWTERATATAAPAYSKLQLAYDIDRGVTVLLGNNVNTWEYDGSDWREITGAGSPFGGDRYATAYDPVHKRVLLFGNSGETWQYRATDGEESWSKVVTVGAPPPRGDAAFFHHKARGTMMLFGGKVGSSQSDDLWELDGDNWTEVETVISPLVRETPTMAYDPIGKAGILYGSPPVLGTWLLRYVSIHPDELCSSEDDVDGDGLAACADPDCEGGVCGGSGERCAEGMCTCQGGSVEQVCGDRFDDDCDGLIDCDDSDCAASAHCTAEASCDNGLDDDGDGMIDCAEPECAGAGVCEAHETSCGDFRDNDGDLLIDCRDPDCYLTPCVTVIP